MSGQIFEMGMDISQIKAALKELEGLQSQIFSLQPPPVTPGEIPPPPVDTGGATSKAALEEIAAAQGAIDAILVKLQAAKASMANLQAAGFSAAELDPLAVGNAAGAPIPYPVSLNTRPGTADPLLAAGYTQAEIEAAATAKQASRSATRKDLAQDNSEILGAQVLTQEEILAHEKALAASLKAQGEKEAEILVTTEAERIAKVEARRIRDLNDRIYLKQQQVTPGSNINLLAEEDQALSIKIAADKRAANAAAREAAAAEVIAERKARFLSGDGAFAVPTAALREDAQIQAAADAEARTIAVAYGKAKQEEYYLQVKYNATAREDLATEEALRQARIGLEKVALAEAQAANGGVLRSNVVAGNVAAKTEAAIQEADTASQLAASTEYKDAKASAAASHAIEAADIALENAQNPEYISAKVRAIEAHVLEAEAVIAETEEGLIAAQGKLAADKKLQQAEIRAAELLILSTDENIKIRSETAAAEKAYKLALDKATADQLLALGIGGGGGPGGGGGAGSAAAGAEGAGAAGVLGGGLLKSVVPMAIGFASIGGLVAAFKEAQELQKTFVIIDDQLTALGKGDQIEPFKQGLLEIAGNSGLAATQVAELGLRFQAAFGGDTQQSLDNTQAAVEAMRITGQSAAEVVNTYEALKLSSNDANLSMRDISDTAVGLAQRFGVSEKETIAFAAQLAPVAAEAGFTAQQLETLGAATAAATGKSATSAADSFGRVLPELQKQAVKLVTLFDDAGKHDIAQQLADSFAKNDISGAFNTLIRNYKELGNAQTQVLPLIAKPRDISSILPIFNNPDAYFNSLEAGKGDAGKSQKRYEELQQTLTVQLGQLVEKLKLLGVQLFEGGIGQAMSALAQSGGVIVEVFGKVLGIFLKVNELMGGIPLTVATLALALKGLAAIYDVTAGSIQKMIGAETAETAAVTENSVAQTTNAESRGLGFFGNIKSAAQGGYAATMEASAAKAAASQEQALLLAPAVSAQNARGLRAASDPSKYNIVSDPRSTLPVLGAENYAKLEAETVASTASMSTLKTGVTKLGASVSGAASGVGAFAESLPGPLVFAGLVLAISQLISTVNEIRGKASVQEDDLKNRILNEPDPVKREAMLKQLDSQHLNLGEGISFAASGYDTPQAMALDIRNQLSQKGAVAQGDALSKLLSSQLGFDIGQIDDTGGKFRGQANANNKDTLNVLLQKIKDNPQDAGARADLEKFMNEIKDANVNVGGKQLKLSEVVTNQGGQTVGQYLQKVYDTANGIADKELADSKDADAKKKDTVDKLANVDTTLAGIKAQIDSGEISPAEGFNRIQQIIASSERLLKNDPHGLDNVTGAKDALEKFKKQNADTLSTLVTNELGFADKLNEFSGTASTPEAKIDRLKGALASGRLTPADQTKVTDQLMAAYKDLYNYRLANANTLQEQLDIINNGVPIDDGTKVSIVAQELRTANSKLFDYSASRNDPTQSKILYDGAEAIAGIIVKTGQNVHDATLVYLAGKLLVLGQAKKVQEDILRANPDPGKADEAKKALDDINRQIDATNSLIGDITNNNVDLGDTKSPGNYNGKTEQEKAKADAAAIKKSAENRASYLKAVNEGDSVVQGQIDLQLAQVNLANAITDDEKSAAQTQIVAANNAIKKAVQARIKGRSDLLKAMNSDDPVAQAQIDLQQAMQELADAKPDNRDEAAANVKNAQDNIKKAVESTQQAYFSYLKQVFSNDPVRAAEISVQAAQEALSQTKVGTQAYYAALSQLDASQKEQQKAQESIDKSNLSYAAALVAGDPIKSAQAAKNIALYELEHAKTVEERNAALIANMQADKSLQNGLSALYASQADVLKASAEYVGDTVKVAQIGVSEANRQLAEVQAKYAVGQAGEADVNKAKADVIRANAASRDARVKKLEDDYSFQYEMGQITKSQYIAYLEGLKSLADGNVTIIRDLDRQIHQLKQGLGADLQFNLPTNIGLPTLYEARRLNQSVGPNGAAAGYQDNRNVSIQILVNSGMDVAQVKQVLGDALGGGRFGNDLRRY